MTATSTATGPRHRKDGPARTWLRPGLGRSQGDKTGASR